MSGTTKNSPMEIADSPPSVRGPPEPLMQSLTRGFGAVVERKVKEAQAKRPARLPPEKHSPFCFCAECSPIKKQAREQAKKPQRSPKPQPASQQKPPRPTDFDRNMTPATMSERLSRCCTECQVISPFTPTGGLCESCLAKVKQEFDAKAERDRAAFVKNLNAATAKQKPNYYPVSPPFSPTSPPSPAKGGRTVLESLGGGLSLVKMGAPGSRRGYQMRAISPFQLPPPALGRVVNKTTARHVKPPPKMVDVGTQTDSDTSSLSSLTSLSLSESAPRPHSRSRSRPHSRSRSRSPLPYISPEHTGFVVGGDGDTGMEITDEDRAFVLGGKTPVIEDSGHGKSPKPESPPTVKVSALAPLNTHSEASPDVPVRRLTKEEKRKLRAEAKARGDAAFAQSAAVLNTKSIAELSAAEIAAAPKSPPEKWVVDNERAVQKAKDGDLVGEEDSDASTESDAESEVDEHGNLKDFVEHGDTETLADVHAAAASPPQHGFSMAAHHAATVADADNEEEGEYGDEDDEAEEDSDAEEAAYRARENRWIAAAAEETDGLDSD